MSNLPQRVKPVTCDQLSS